MLQKLFNNQLSFHELCADSTTNSFPMTAKPKILNTPEVGRGSLHVYCGDLQRDSLQLCKKRVSKNHWGKQGQGCDCCCALQEKSKQEWGKQGKGCDCNSIERSRQVATCQQVEVHEVLLTEDASTFSSSINRGRLDSQVNTHLLLVVQDRYKNVKKRGNKHLPKGVQNLTERKKKLNLSMDVKK